VSAAPAFIEAAFLRACRLDVAVRKPGNVSVESPGHRMTAAQFMASAQAAAPALCRAGAPVGQRIEDAMRATWAAAACNTNLGILLLCAPLAAAAESLGRAATSAELRAALADVLASLDMVDARAAFRAIALANPGGLGTTAEQDVRSAPSIGLLGAMALAAPRDRIAHQYAHGFEDVFDIGLPALEDASASLLAMPPDGIPTSALKQAVLRVYLGYLAGFADSHIVRKHGWALAQTVIDEAVLHVGAPAPDAAAMAAWDDRLKAAGINPGTSADLTVASLMLAALLTANDPA